jgi:hypothetical protein
MRALLGLVVAALILSVFSLAAGAQQNTIGGPGPAVGQGNEKQMTPDEFIAFKSRNLNMIEVRRKKLDEEKVCVEAATTPTQIRKCRLHHPMGPGSRGQRGSAQQPLAGEQQ